jgi:hypothetical protein
MDSDSHVNTAPESHRERSLKLEKEEVLYSWGAPVRPFKRRNKEFFTTVLTVACLVALILFFIDGFFPVLVIIAIVFLIYVLSTIQPDDVEHQITNRGINFGGTKTYWDDLVRFWFTTRFGSELLVLDSKRIISRIEMVINPEEKEKIQKILEDYIPFEEAAPNFLDKAATWLSKRVPLEG